MPLAGEGVLDVVLRVLEGSTCRHVCLSVRLQLLHICVYTSGYASGEKRVYK